MHQSDKPLRILVIVNLPWDARLGASRVWMELAEQWRAGGHTVEKFSLSDAFPAARATRVTFALRQLIFTRKAARFVRKNAQRFDVIDALIGTLPFSRDELGFPGIVVARSVGLYRFYDRFERSAEQRWPRPDRGKLLGRLLYRFLRRRRLQSSEVALRKADLINVPNAEEAAYLSEELGPSARIIVQPYGLTGARRRALSQAAADVDVRLAQKRVCFIGMWGARKGAHDWAAIIDRVRNQVPEARFRFLGTMVEERAIRRDLGPGVKGLEFISKFEPDELPRLLAGCTVGAFPSYVEGFGLAVIEQLAAGIPTIAYDTAGPREIQRDAFPEFLVSSGNVDRFASAIGRVLRLAPELYEQVSRASEEVGARFSWREIARETLAAYRELLEERARPIVFVQPFSLGSAGGGPRILRALLEQAPFPWRSICCSPAKPRPWHDELHLRSRRSWGRIEHSRLAALPKKTGWVFARRFRRRLKRRCLELGARAIHAVPHAGLDFAEAHRVARELSLPFFLSLHDDLAYTAAGVVVAKQRETAMIAAWREANARFVISDALGREYCRRYGPRDFHVVTDGLSALSRERVETEPDRLRIYFMGLFHLGYEQNLRALLGGITMFEREHPETSVSITMRCEHVRSQVLNGTNSVTVLPFADEAQVRRDMESADLLYMPMPFGAEHEKFARYSLSTKMVTYVGSGVPILYHGPAASAVFQLLSRRRAAISITSLEPAEVADVFRELNVERRTEVAANALSLAQNEFMLADQYRKFWRTITHALVAG